MQLSRQADRRVQSARHEREQSIADKTSLSGKMGKGFSHQIAGPARNPFKAKHADNGNSGAKKGERLRRRLRSNTSSRPTCFFPAITSSCLTTYWIVPASSSTVMKNNNSLQPPSHLHLHAMNGGGRYLSNRQEHRTSVGMIETHHAIHLKNTLDASAIDDRATRRISSLRLAPRRNPTAKRAPHAAREDNIRLGLSNK
jgi:hypothetical protein